MELTWLDPAHPDPGDVAGAVAVLEAARPVDAPYRLAVTTVSGFRSRLRNGGDGEPPEVAVTRNPTGRVVGVLMINLPGRDNTHLASVQVVVDPVERRRGWGRGLFEAGVARARAAGRRLVCAATHDGTAGMPFLKAMDMDPVLPEVLRRQDLLGLDWPRLDQELAQARQRAAGYELLRLPGSVPEELLPAVASLTEAINDAPTDDLDFEDEVFSPERIRAYEASQAAHGRTLYRLVARVRAEPAERRPSARRSAATLVRLASSAGASRAVKRPEREMQRATGALAGHTVVAVDTEQPWQGWQHDTSVVRAHRGHRLGLLLKLEMVRWLREVEPQLRAIETGNAASNEHMIRVNEILGYEVVARTVEWQRHLTD